MKYYELMYNHRNSHNCISCEKGNLGKINEYIVTIGQYIYNWEDHIEFKYNPNNGELFTDYLFNIYGWLVVSDKFIGLCDEYINAKVQYLNINIKNELDNSITSSYKVINILDIVDAIELEHSDYSEFELDNEKFISITKYAINSEKVNGHHIFRLKNSTIPIFISEKIKSIIEQNNLTGFDFLEIKSL